MKRQTDQKDITESPEKALEKPVEIHMEADT
jgi:hypothetical protein